MTSTEWPPVQLKLPGLTITPTGAQVPDGFDPDQACSVLAGLNRWASAWHWVVGDLAEAMIRDLGQAATLQLLDPLDLDTVTIGRCITIARAIPLDRRVEGLSWSHHVEVARLPADAQERWLATALQASLSVHDLRAAITDERADDQLPLPDPPQVPMPPRTRVRDLLAGQPEGVWLRWQPSTGTIQLEKEADHG